MSGKCPITNLSSVDPRRIVFEFTFSGFWLTEEDDEEDDENEDEDEESENEDEDEFSEEGWLMGSGKGSIYLADDVIDDDEADGVDVDDDGIVHVTDFSFDMDPNGIKIGRIKNVSPGFTGIDAIIVDYNGSNETEFIGSEINYLVSGGGRGLTRITTLSKRYVG